MPTQKVPLETLQKIRQHIRSALVLPESENYPKARSLRETEVSAPDSLASLGDLFHLGDLPEVTVQMPNDQGRWFISAVNPGCALMKLPGLTLKPGIRLVTYLYRIEKNGLSATWALPEVLSTTAFLEDALKTSQGKDHSPKPEGSLGDLMEAITGDRSPMSFVIASIVRRELREFGTLGNDRDWSNHRLIDALPSQVQWKWHTQALDLSPKVRLLPEGKAVLEFFTCRTTAPIAIFQHVDHYSAGAYQAKGVDRAVAIAQKLVRT